MSRDEASVDREAPGGSAPLQMRALALFRIVLGMFAWCAPRTMNRVFGVPRADESPALTYMNRVFGVRAVALGVGYLASRGDARRLWHGLWLMCDSADTMMGTAMALRGELSGVTAAQALIITAGATAIDLASTPSCKEPVG